MADLDLEYRLGTAVVASRPNAVKLIDHVGGAELSRTQYVMAVAMVQRALREFPHDEALAVNFARRVLSYHLTGGSSGGK